MAAPLRIGLVGCGGIALANHVPGLRYCPDSRLTALCDTSAEALHRAAERTGVGACFESWETMLATAEVDAVILATPNVAHAPAAVAAAEAGKHVLCEKPLALDFAQVEAMLAAAEYHGVRHMTAFTYRFVPAMRYLLRLVADGAVGRPLTLHARRIYGDDPGRTLRWRQQRALAGTGVLGDFLSHRLDIAMAIAGPITELTCDLRLFEPERGGEPADVEDWCGVLARFAGGASGMLEASRVGTGHGGGATSPDLVEVSGTEGAVSYELARPHEVLRSTNRGPLCPEPVPSALLTTPGSPRDPDEGEPLRAFRYDQVFEFVTAIREERDCVPSFHEGVRVQAAMEAAVRAADERRWVTLEQA